MDILESHMDAGRWCRVSGRRAGSVTGNKVSSRPPSFATTTVKFKPLSSLQFDGDLGGFPGGSDGKESACSARGPGWIPGSGRASGERNGSPRQYSCLEHPMDRGAWWATVHGVAKSQTRLSD